jgi:thiol-disulfide isomerase/thioredoxin
MSSMLKPVERRARSWFGVAGWLLATVPMALAQELPTNFIVHEALQPVDGFRFEDTLSRARSIADFRGKVVLLNIWATWCTPCRKEIPALDHLDAALNGADFTILAVSIDRGGIGAVRKLFGELGVRTLPAYVDSSGEAMRSVHVNGLPTSLIIDREGREVARVVGPAEWDAATMIEYLRHVVSGQNRNSDGRFDGGGIAVDANRPHHETPPDEQRGTRSSGDQRNSP